MRWFLALCLFLGGQTAFAAGIKVESLNIQQEEGRYLLDARLQYKLSKAVVEALDSGVAMTFRLQMRLLPDKAPFWQRPTFNRRLTYRLSYHALASVYELLSPNADQVQRFTTREAALRAMGRLTKIPLIQAADLKPTQSYQLRLTAKLDIESLPVPLRPLAYLSNDWTLNSELGTWPLRH